MEAVLAPRRSATVTVRLGPVRGAGLGAWTLGFAAPLYLALRGGGYEALLRDQVGLVLWWIVLLGVLLGVLPATRLGRHQRLMLAALVAFAAWTGLGALWSQSGERTVAELSRLSTYSALLTLALLSVRAQARRWLVGGITTAIGTIAVLALLSRLHPAWFPPDQTAQFLPGSRSRLNYPLNYWNGLAAMMALGIPLALHFATRARRLVLRGLCAAALPAMVATLYLTFSRGGWIELAAGLMVYFVLTPGRGWRLATLAASGASSALLIAAIRQRPAVDHGLLATAAGRHGGSELIAVALVVCAGAALLQSALALLEAHAPAPAWLARMPSPRPRLWLASGMVLSVVFLASGGPHALSRAWRDFKNPGLQVAQGQQNTEGRLGSVSGNGRYQYWSSGLDAFSRHPVGGVGAGTFQLWWAAHGSISSYVVNAHSLYFETLAETGLLGAALLLLAFGAGLTGIFQRWRRSRDDRGLLAAMLGASVAFAVAAGVDWVWQIPAVSVVFLSLVAVGAARRGSSRTRPAPASGRPHLVEAIRWIALALAGVAAIAVPTASGLSLRESQAQARDGRLSPALHEARTAAGWQPYGASPQLQQALVLELKGEYASAAGATRRAAENAPSDWSTWLVLARIEAERGHVDSALAAYRKARSLDPRDPLFTSR
jgi:O-antigen ligase